MDWFSRHFMPETVFFRHFMPETVFLCWLNLLYVIHACWIFCVVILASKKLEKIPVCVCFYSC